MELKIMGVLDEQISVQFTGKVNILSSMNRQYLGHVLFKSGEIVQVIFQQFKGLKAFYHLIIQEYSLASFSYVVEPEIVEEKERQIHYPFAVIKNKLGEVLKLYRESLKLRPPDNVKIIIEVGFIKASTPVTPQEFEVLELLTEWNSPNDIYQHCNLLDHEITLALVNLRKKGALKILSTQNNP
jgi:hypothetical protein